MANYIVANRVKEMAQKQGMRVGGDFSEALDKEVEQMVMRAVRTAKGYGSKTLQPRDLGAGK